MSDGAPYVQYQFLRLDAVFHNLESNERIVAKQGFLGTWETFQSRVGLASYAVTGLRPDCDVLSIRVASSLELLQDMTCRLQSSGLGKFLSPAFSYLARAAGPRYAIPAKAGEFAPGEGRHLFFSPWSRTPEWHEQGEKDRAEAQRVALDAAKRLGARVHPGLEGLDEHDELLAVEVEDPRAYQDFMQEWRRARAQTHAAAGPTFIGVLKDIRDQVDCLG